MVVELYDSRLACPEDNDHGAVPKHILTDEARPIGLPRASS